MTFWDWADNHWIMFGLMSLSVLFCFGGLADAIQGNIFKALSTRGRKP